MRAAFAWAVALLAVAQASVGPRWAAFGGVRVGAAQDELVALNAECRPLADLAASEEKYSPAFVAQFAFGFSLPLIQPDTAAVAQALGHAALCRIDMLDGRLFGLVVTIDRTVVGATFFPSLRDKVMLPKDSVRALLLSEWGQPTNRRPTLDSWLGARFRSYLMNEPGGAGYRVILVDVNACSAFDRRVHQFSHHGTARPC